MEMLQRISKRISKRFSPEVLQLDDWNRRLAMLFGALMVGLLAIAFAYAGDYAQHQFLRLSGNYPYAPLVVTPLLFVGLYSLTQMVAPEARGSGIPQVIAASRDPEAPYAQKLVSLKVGVAKLVLTVGAMFGGASVGREGPTVQLGASVMVAVHRLFGVRATPGVLIAGGAAGVAAAFNTPLAGIAFAIEELAVAYEQRVAVLAMAAVVISGLTSQGIAGDYVYFGQVDHGLPLTIVLIATPLAGIVGGLSGGLFARLLLAFLKSDGTYKKILGKRPLVTAFVCGLIIAGVGVLSGGATWGTGYEATQELLAGTGGELWFAPAKFIATLATSASGIAGGIFAPSLAVGAGVGNILTLLFPPEHAGAIVMLGMAGYFVGVVRAPLTAVIIISEATGNSGLILPLFGAALIGDWAGSMVCREKLYHTLSKDFVPKFRGQSRYS